MRLSTRYRIIKEEAGALLILKPIRYCAQAFAFCIYFPTCIVRICVSMFSLLVIENRLSFPTNNKANVIPCFKLDSYRIIFILKFDDALSLAIRMKKTLYLFPYTILSDCRYIYVGVGINRKGRQIRLDCLYLMYTLRGEGERRHISGTSSLKGQNWLSSFLWNLRKHFETFNHFFVTILFFEELTKY